MVACPFSVVAMGSLQENSELLLLFLHITISLELWVKLQSVYATSCIREICRLPGRSHMAHFYNNPSPLSPSLSDNSSDVLHSVRKGG